ncbi:LysM peptidoglycan-binding domain-containing protein [Terribacillus sp. DMT04]|uniref:LysM peptidoglycan-binding domain-containing protein n=1 Tax=Terribacillus sp. DMT04 TaxID=2850441 RepID=UPI001C2BD073|nr:LysM peptidoglycan-binding domain-containing protein [Terribacillus sp. DMT04]QXE00584.1 LysM peptidoglycan-binding domain-containing protein [Terribacillus sp. DMT04]
MSKNETTPFTFDIKESLSFRAEDQLQDLIGIALEPEINIQEFEHDISVHGVIELTGEYHPVEEVVEGSAVAVSPGTREIENVEKQQTGTNTFYHRFPVEISVPKHRIRQLNEVYVAIDQFDYDIPGTNVLELHATVAIYGVTEEQRQPETQAPAPEQPYYPIPTFEQGEPVQSYTDEIAEQIEAAARENYQDEKQAYSFQTEQTENVTSEAAAEPRDEQQPYNFNQEAYSASPQPEETEQLETQSYSFSQAQYETDVPADSADEAEDEQPDESEIEEAYLQEQAIQEAHLQEQALEEAHAEALRANEAYEELRKQAAYEADQIPSILQEEEADAAEDDEQKPEEPYVLPDELEDAFQAADFRQAAPEDDNVYTLDRELPHEAPAEAPDFTFTYQAKQEEDVPPPPAFEAPPVLASEEDDRWKYKETKTLSEFFGSKTAEPTEVPQADLEEDDIDDNPYTDSYKDLSVQEVPVNQELQPQDLAEEAEEQETADDRSNTNFLVSMFGAREETFTKVRVCIVQERDTLEKIATRYDVPASSILSSNKLEEDAVAEGQLLVIPQQRRAKKG